MDFGDVADFAGPENFGGDAVGFVGEALVAHLGGDLVFDCGVVEEAGFPGGAAEGFFDVDVLAGLHVGEGDGGVHEVGDGDGDGVDVLAFFIEHRAEVAIDGQLFEALHGRGSAVEIDVAEGDDVLGGGGFAENFGSATAAADGGDVEFVVEGLIAEGAEGGDAAEAGRGDGTGEEGPEEEIAARGHCGQGIFLWSPVSTTKGEGRLYLCRGSRRAAFG